MGVPFYGRSYTLQDTTISKPGSPISGPGKEGKYTQEKGFLSYFEICERLLEGNNGNPWMHYTDEIGSPYMVQGDQWVGFEDPRSISQKVYLLGFNCIALAKFAILFDRWIT